MNNKFIISLIICIITAGGLGFYGGMVYGKQQTAPQLGAGGRGGNGGTFAAGQGRTGVGRFGGPGGNGGAGGFSNGEIVSKDADSLTLKLMDGGSKIILMSSSTHIGKMTDGSANDLLAGTNVMVTGTTNTDGSITASNIQIRPAGSAGDAMIFRGGRAGGQPGQPPAGQGIPQQP